MTDIILCGCSGNMGHVITQCCERFDECKIVCGIDLNTEAKYDYPVYADINEFQGKADVIIDFSHPNALRSVLDYAVKNKIPVVESTTGLSDEQINEIKDASKKVAVFHSANMSLGVNLLCELAKKAVNVLGNGFDIEIVEMHHNQKIDSPSGTALMIADAINEELPVEFDYEFDRHSKRSKRTDREIGIHSVRGGTIVGEHEVIFAGNDEIIKLSHSASSKQIFANGAINAARYLAKQNPGLYSMKDLI